ncbi:MAG: hypothetical protein AB8F74_00510 [Saprospiraceae bacterium]
MSSNAEEHLPPYRVRPRFEFTSEFSTTEIIEKINTALRSEDAPCKGHAKQRYARIFLPKKEQHYWSPQLSVTLEEMESGTLVRGLYGPRPEVWTMFIFFYSLIAFAIVVVSVIGYSSFSLGQGASILYSVPVLIIAFLSLYFVSYSGQKLGHDQMVTLHGFIEDILEME